MKIYTDQTFGYPIHSKGAVTFTFSCCSCSLLNIEGMSPEVAAGNLFIISFPSICKLNVNTYSICKKTRIMVMAFLS